MALVRDSDSDDWLATAAGPLDGQTVHARGSQPEQELRRIRGPSHGISVPADALGYEKDPRRSGGP